MVQRTQHLWLENAYLSGDWQSSVRLSINSTGNIISISTGHPDVSDERISGPVIPGIPNVHSHAFQRAAAGLTEKRPPGRQAGIKDNFWTWRKIIHKFVRRLTHDDQLAIASQLYVEMLKAGYTAVGEFHYLHLDPEGNAYNDPCEMSHCVVGAANRAGIGLTLLPVLYSVGGYGNVRPNKGQRRYMLGVDDCLQIVESLVKKYRTEDQIQIGIAPHSLRQVPAKPLADALAGFASIDTKGPIHIHIAEQRSDVDTHIKHIGARPVAWLLDNAEVNSQWCLVHATHMDTRETKALAATGAVAGLCPTTEGNLGDGLFPFSEFLDSGGIWGIGSDSHISVSPIEELRWLEYGQRLIHQSRNVAAPKGGGPTGARLYRDALAGGAQALSRSVGALEPGYRADLLVLDPSHVNFAGLSKDDLLDSLVFSGNINPIQHVMCGGKWVIRNGHHADEEAIADAYRITVSRLLDIAL